MSVTTNITYFHGTARAECYARAHVKKHALVSDWSKARDITKGMHCNVDRQFRCNKPVRGVRKSFPCVFIPRFATMGLLRFMRHLSCFGSGKRRGKST